MVVVRGTGRFDALRGFAIACCAFDFCEKLVENFGVSGEGAAEAFCVLETGGFVDLTYDSRGDLVAADASIQLELVIDTR